MKTSDALITLKDFIGREQLYVLGDCLHGEEKAFFEDLLRDLAERVNTMPKTYEQDGMGEDAIVCLHYFSGNMDWYITEKDMLPQQFQAFGLANLGYGGELGYISIAELVDNNVELDLYWQPKPLREVMEED